MNPERFKQIEEIYHAVLKISSEERDLFPRESCGVGKADKYEMDFGDWNGEDEMCFKDDEDGDGFSDEECSEQPNQDTN